MQNLFAEAHGLDADKRPCSDLDVMMLTRAFSVSVIVSPERQLISGICEEAKEGYYYEDDIDSGAKVEGQASFELPGNKCGKQWVSEPV